MSAKSFFKILFESEYKKIQDFIVYDPILSCIWGALGIATYLIFAALIFSGVGVVCTHKEENNIYFPFFPSPLRIMRLESSSQF